MASAILNIQILIPDSWSATPETYRNTLIPIASLAQKCAPQRVKLEGGSPRNPGGKLADCINEQCSAEPNAQQSLCTATKPAYRIASCGPAEGTERREDDPSVVRLRVLEGHYPWLQFMIDNGVLVDTDQAVPLTGITDHSIDIYSTAKLHLRDRPVTFVVLKDDSPLDKIEYSDEIIWNENMQ